MNESFRRTRLDDEAASDAAVARRSGWPAAWAAVQGRRACKRKDRARRAWPSDQPHDGRGRLPARSDPANNQFDRPSAIGESGFLPSSYQWADRRPRGNASAPPSGSGCSRSPSTSPIHPGPFAAAAESHRCSASATTLDRRCRASSRAWLSASATSRSTSYRSPKNFSACSATWLWWFAHSSWNLPLACAMRAHFCHTELEAGLVAAEVNGNELALPARLVPRPRQPGEVSFAVRQAVVRRCRFWPGCGRSNPAFARSVD